MRKLVCLLLLLVARSAHASPKPAHPAFLESVRLPRLHALATSLAADAVGALGGLTVSSSSSRTLAVKPDFGRGPMAALEIKF